MLLDLFSVEYEPPAAATGQTNSAPKPDHPRGTVHHNTSGINPLKLAELRHQKKIIAEKLEAQQLRLEQIALNKRLETEKIQDKQTQRHILAIEREYRVLMAKVAADKLALKLLKRRYDEEEAFIILCMADPFFGIGGGRMN